MNSSRLATTLRRPTTPSTRTLNRPAYAEIWRRAPSPVAIKVLSQAIAARHFTPR